MFLCCFRDFVEDEDCRQAKEALKRVTFNLPGESDDSEGEDMADILGGKSQNATKPESKSSFEKRQDKASFSSRAVLEYLNLVGCHFISFFFFICRIYNFM